MVVYGIVIAKKMDDNKANPIPSKLKLKFSLVKSLELKTHSPTTQISKPIKMAFEIFSFNSQLENKATNTGKKLLSMRVFKIGLIQLIEKISVPKANVVAKLRIKSSLFVDLFEPFNRIFCFFALRNANEKPTTKR